MLKILFLTNIPSPYRVNFFNELGKSCELTVLFEKEYSSERDSSWLTQNFVHFKAVILKGRSTDTDQAICPSVLRYLSPGRYDAIIVANAMTPTGMLAIFYMKFKKMRYLIEGDGGFPKQGKGFKESLKRHLICGASFYFSTANMHDAYYLRYGAERSKLIRYPFSSLNEKDILQTCETTEEKAVLKQKLGLENRKTVITVGQFIHRKGFDVLLKAWEKMPSDTSLIILGGGEKEREYQQFIGTHHLTNITLLGFKPVSEVLEYFKACDLFVLPTREDIWGLVINEAMACGLPVITTDRCVAGLELVSTGENGYLVPVEDADALAKKMEFLLENDVLAAAMGRASLEKIRPYTIERMAKSHLAVLQQQFGE